MSTAIVIFLMGLSGCDMIRGLISGGPPPSLEAANNALKAGDLVAAGERFDEALAAAPTNVDAATGAAYLAMLEGSYAEADRILASVEQEAGEQAGDIALRRALVALEAAPEFLRAVLEVAALEVAGRAALEVAGWGSRVACAAATTASISAAAVAVSGGGGESSAAAALAEAVPIAKPQRTTTSGPPASRGSSTVAISCITTEAPPGSLSTPTRPRSAMKAPSRTSRRKSASRALAVRTLSSNECHPFEESRRSLSWGTGSPNALRYRRSLSSTAERLKRTIRISSGRMAADVAEEESLHTRFHPSSLALECV